MLILKILPVIAYLGIIAVNLMIAYGVQTSPKMKWALPVTVGIALLVFTLVTLAQEGLVQFWLNHATTLSGNQVWFDLVIAVTICFYLIAPRARAVGMPLVPWAIAVVTTACIALLPMLARLIWLEQRREATAPE